METQNSSIVNTFFFEPVSRYVSEPDAVGYLPSTEIKISPEILNDALFNMTIAFANSAYNRWNQTVSATTATYPLTYVFSRPLNLILTYFVPLALSLPVLVYSIFVLYARNHVSAMTDSFTQILMTTGGSKTITEMAAGGSLGGKNNVPQNLKDLKIRYGDVTFANGMDDMTEVRRAGFGVEGEVTPLRRGAQYGATADMELS